MNRISVLLGDRRISRHGLRAILRDESDIDVVCEADDGRQALDMTRRLRPDVAVLDIAMPLVNGLEATRQILKHFPGTKVIILSAHSDDNYIDYVIHLGSTGYVIKQSSVSFLSKAIRETQKSHQKFAQPISAFRQDVGKSSRIGEFVSNKTSQLTTREVELIQMVAEGNANKQIAAEFNISIKTVEKHRQNVMKKLDIHDTAGLTRYAIATGIIELEYA